MVFAIFYHYQHIFEKNFFPCKALCFIGRHTLDIYLLHWFFLPELSFMRNWFAGNKNLLAEFFITLIIITAIVLLCTLISYITRSSKLLGHYLWGAKYEKQ